jgi:hypothetical protein
MELPSNKKRRRTFEKKKNVLKMSEKRKIYEAHNHMIGYNWLIVSYWL